MKIALVGMMGSGKTGLGRMLAAYYGIDFFDLDHVIEERSQMSIACLFRDFGEGYFRDIEEDALKMLAECDAPMALACGGGVVLRAANRLVLKKEFITVWLNVPILELRRRLEEEREHRPLLASEKWRIDLKNIFRQREQFYREAAAIQYTWRRDQSPEESARVIENLIGMKKEKL